MTDPQQDSVMTLNPEQTAKIKPLLVISALYLPYFVLLTLISGHLNHLGDPSLFFSPWTDATGYKLVADYYTSLGESVRPSDYLLALRPFLFPLYLGLYKVIGIAGVQILQIVMNTTSLWLVFCGSKTLSKRSWPAVGSTILLAVTPSFNFLVFHAMTESLSILLVCMFVMLLIEHFKKDGRDRLFLTTLVLSTLLAIKPIILPFWALFVAYYISCYIKGQTWNLWRPIAATTPVLAQLIISFVLTGTPTLSPSGSVNISEWYFPVVYGEKEYKKFTRHESQEAEEGIRKYPKLSDKVEYLIRNYRESIKSYVYILFGSHLTAGSHYVLTHTTTDEGNEAVLMFLQWCSVYLTRLFTYIHATMLILMLGLFLYGARMYEQPSMWIFYIFAALLILPAGLTYSQGDRYILLAEPLWLVGHSALIGLLLDVVANRIQAKMRIGDRSIDSGMSTLD